MTGNTRIVALCFLLTLAFNLAGIGGNSLWDRDEPRYAAATRRMADWGEGVVTHFNDKYRFNKPSLIYWLMLGQVRLFGPGKFAVRLLAAFIRASCVPSQRKLDNRPLLISECGRSFL